MLRAVKETPVLICEVEMLPEDEDVSAEACAAAAEVADLLRSTLRLSDLMQGIQAGEEDATAVPQELEQLDPQHLSYWWVPHAYRPVLLVGATCVASASTIIGDLGPPMAHTHTLCRVQYILP